MMRETAESQRWSIYVYNNDDKIEVMRVARLMRKIMPTYNYLEIVNIY